MAFVFKARFILFRGAAMNTSYLRCMSSSDIAIAHETFKPYELTDKETEQAMRLVEARAMDTSYPFRPYYAAHVAAAQVLTKRQP